MEPYRSPHKPSVSRVKVVNGSTPSTRSARHTDLASNHDSRHDLKIPKHHVWHINTHQSNNSDHDPISPSTSLTSQSNNSLPSFGFTSGSNTSNIISSGYSPRHEFGGKPAFVTPMAQYRMASHRNVDHEEAMDIDAQDDLHVDMSTTNQTRVLPNFNESNNGKWKVLNTSKLNLPQPKEAKETTVSSPSTDSASSTTELPKTNKVSAKKKAIYIVLHVSDVVIGNVHAKASAPVKIYAERVFLEIEFKDSADALPLKLSCKDISRCTVSFEPPKPVIIFTLTNNAMKSIADKVKVLILNPDKQDGAMNRLVLHLSHHRKGLPKTVKEDIIELFQKRMCNDIQWNELSSTEVQKLLQPEEKTSNQIDKNDTSSSKCSESEQQTSVEEQGPVRKILTPKRSRSVPKKTLIEATVTAKSSLKVDVETKKAENEAASEVLTDKIVTRSRRRKAEVKTVEPHSPPKISATTKEDKKTTSTSSLNDDQAKDDKKDDKEDRPQQRNLLQHHSKMESHITMLGKHSEEQRHTLEHHQKLLSLEREQQTRSYERIQELQTTNHERQLCLIQKNETISLLERENESQKVTIRQLQQELTQEREACSMFRKVQTDLVQARRDLDEEKVVRGLRDQQLQERQTELAEMRRLCTEESNSKRRVEEELQRTHNSCLQHMDELENLRLFRQTQEHELQGRDERLQASEQRYQDERTMRTSLEDQLRLIRSENDELQTSRNAAQTELTQERERRREESEAYAQERQNYEQRIRESSNSLAECERQLQALRTTVNNNSQNLLDDHRRIEPRDWIIRREEVTTSDVSLGTGAWGTVKVGTFRSCKVAVKQIHELILSPHNRRLFEREMSIASRCRHPCLLQFIGATNDDGIPLFLTELLDTDLRAVLACRSLHQEEIITIALDVARALNYLHLSKPFPIIHRDISSSNVLLWKRDTCWRAKLSDYGAANFMRQYMTINPGAGIYAAPEASTSQQSPKVDIYSFGLLLCELCIRELPVPQQTQEQIALVTNGMLRELVIRCVRVDPEARPTMADVIMLLEQQQERLLDHGLVSVNGRSATL